MTDNDTKMKCEINETGVCALHNIEVERRQSVHRATDKSILSLEKSLEALASKLPGISRMVYAIFISGALLLSMITAGFIYTRDTGQRSLERDEVLATQQENLAEKMSQMAISAARSEGQQSTLMTEMRTFTITAQKILDEHKYLDKQSQGDK